MQQKKHKTKKTYIKWGVFVPLFYLFYFSVGALLPFAVPKEPSGQLTRTFDTDTFLTPSGSNDRAYIAEDNADALALRLDMFAKAQHSIRISTFDIRPGKSWDKMAGALIAAADRGVKVQILVDGMYGMLHMKQLPDFYAVGTHANIEIRFYNPIHPLKPWTVNGRLHDKYILADDNLLLAGGRNTFDYFLQTNRKSIGYDREVFVYHESGDASQNVFTEMATYFSKIWDASHSKPRYHTMPAYMESDITEKQRAYREAYKNISLPDYDYLDLTIPVEHVSFLHNPPHTGNKEPTLFYQLTQLMLEAKEQVIIQTPYANYSSYMSARMREIAKKVPRTELLINSVAVGDNVMASSDYLIHKEEVLSVGMDVYEFFGDHSSHSKSVLIDQDISIIGSFNFDMRSTYLSTETMIVITGEEFQTQLAENMNFFKEQSLKCSTDDTYEASSTVAEKEIPKKRLLLYRILGPVLQLFRYLV